MGTGQMEDAHTDPVEVTEVAVGDTVVDRNGVQGRVEEHAPGEAVPAQIVIRLENGDRYSLPLWMLERQDDRLTVPLVYQDLKERYLLESEGDDQEDIVIPVIAEDLAVYKRAKTTARVRITKQVSEREVDVDEPVYWEEVDVKRVPVNRFVEAPVEQRVEGDTLIIPVVEEVLVVSKRLKLVEELHVTKRQHAERAQKRFTLRREEVSVERTEGTEDVAT